MTITHENTSTPKTTAHLQSELSATAKSKPARDAEHDSNNDSIDSVDSIDISQLSTPLKVDLSPVYEFLGARTSQAWVNAAIDNLPLIIQDHANC